MTAPLLLIDVDGVLSVYGGGRADPDTLVGTLVDGIPHLLSRSAASTLLELAPAFECVWCTGWEDRADLHLPHLLGLPRGWPHIRFPDGAEPAGTGSSPGSTPTRGRSVRSPGSTTRTTPPAGTGHDDERARRSW